MSNAPPEQPPPPYNGPPPSPEQQAAAATPNQMAASGPASAAHAEWQRSHEQSLALQAQQLALQAQQLALEAARAKQIEHDRIHKVLPAMERWLALVEAQPRAIHRAPLLTAELAAVLAAGGGAYSARARPVGEMLLVAVAFGAIGGIGGLTVGYVVREVVLSQGVAVPLQMPPAVERELLGQLGQVGDWRWRGLHDSWRSLAVAQNDLRGAPWSDAAAAFAAIQTVRRS